MACLEQGVGLPDLVLLPVLPIFFACALCCAERQEREARDAKRKKEQEERDAKERARRAALTQAERAAEDEAAKRWAAQFLSGSGRNVGKYIVLKPIEKFWAD